MKICDTVHQLKVEFNVTPQVKRYVYVYIIEGKEGDYLIDAGAVSYTHLTLPTIYSV